MTAQHAAVLVAIFRFYDLRSNGYLLIPIGYILVNVTLFFGMQLRDQLRQAGAADQPGRRGSDSAWPVIRSVLLLPVDYGTLCLTFILLPVHQAFLVAYAALFAANLVFAARALVKAFRTLASIDSSPTAAG